MPLARVGLSRAGTRPRGRLAEEVDVRPDDRQRRAQLMGDDRQELGPRGIERRQLLQPALDLGLQPALRDDAREERGDRRQELDLGATEVALRQRLDVEHADDLLVPHERHRQHRVQAAHVEPADPREAAVGGDVAHGDRQAGRGRATGDPLADRQAHPADLAAVQAVRCGERQPIRVPVGQVERADLDAHGRRRPVDDRAHQLVPVACLRGEPRDLVEERQLVETAPGGGTWPRRLRDGFGRGHRPIMAHRARVRGAACARPSRGAGRRRPRRSAHARETAGRRWESSSGPTGSAPPRRATVVAQISLGLEPSGEVAHARPAAVARTSDGSGSVGIGRGEREDRTSDVRLARVGLGPGTQAFEQRRPGIGQTECLHQPVEAGRARAGRPPGPRTARRATRTARTASSARRPASRAMSSTLTAPSGPERSDERAASRIRSRVCCADSARRRCTYRRLSIGGLYFTGHSCILKDTTSCQIQGASEMTTNRTAPGSSPSSSSAPARPASRRPSASPATACPR